MEEFIYYNDLYDCYSSLLTEKQRIYFEEYYFNNLSLSEISENYGVSRNAIHKQIQITIEKLNEYEEKLQLHKKKKFLEEELQKNKDKKIKNFITKLLQLFIIVFIFNFNIEVSAANLINSIEIDVDIQENGDAITTEIWDVYTESGTEIYRTYGNLNDYAITNFNVTDETGKKYTNKNSWDVSLSFDNKKYTSGTRYEKNQLELCWGISEYGSKQYILNYNIEKLVKQYSDGQGLYFSFLASNMSPLPKKAKIKIHSNYYNFNKNNSIVDAKGYNGKVGINNNAIILETNSTITSENYMTAIVQIKENAFTPKDSIGENFNDYISNTNKIENTTNKKSYFPNILWAVILVIIMCMISIPYLLNMIPHQKKTNFNKKKYKVNNDNNYYREIPCNNNLAEIYWIAYNYDLIDDESCIFGAYLLKWIFENRISISNSNGQNSFDFSNIGNFNNPLEENLKNIFISAAKRDFILDSFEFKEWCKEQYSQIISWLDDFIFEGQKSLENRNLLKKEEIVTEYNYQKFTKTKIEKTKELDDTATKLNGLKRFMLDFSDFKDKSILEVSTWENYLIVAQILGIAEKVSEQLNETYTDYDFVKKLNVSTVINMSTDYSRTCYKTVLEVNKSFNIHTNFGTGNGQNANINIRNSSSGGRSSGGGIR